MGEATRSDHVQILSGTSLNVIGIVISAVATLIANILMTRTLGADGFGVATLMTQGSFVLSFATRSGMDMAVLRDVAIEIGESRPGRIRAPVARATLIAVVVSTLFGVLGILFAGPIRDAISVDPDKGRYAVEAACAGLPFLALANVWLSATRGLKIMRYTLFIFWAGQPVAWILLMLLGWQLSETAWMATLAYSASWAGASLAAYWAWRRESRAWPADPMEPGDMPRLLRYAGARAPAALFSQLLFWTDLFVLARFVGDVETGIYAAALRAGQAIILLLTSLSLMFAPFVADLHNRGETEQLDRLFKDLTRWTLAATMPAFLVLLVAPDAALRLFGSEFTRGDAALLIVLSGQFVNVATGSVGFVLIMVGRTGWDLVVYAAALVLDVGLALALCPRYGMTGAAIANAVSFAISKWARLALVHRFVHIQPYDRNYLHLLAPSAAALAVMWPVHGMLEGPKWMFDLAATGLVGAITFAIVFLLVGITQEERRGLWNLVARLRA
jgi:O-antigen/teichoic acid export membrane protein